MVTKTAGAGVRVLPLELFRFDAKSRVLSAEASDFGPARAGAWWLTPAGISVRSHHTGRVERFRLAAVDKDAEGDVLCWRFAPAGPLPKVGEVVIFND